MLTRTGDARSSIMKHERTTRIQYHGSIGRTGVRTTAKRREQHTQESTASRTSSLKK